MDTSDIFGDGLFTSPDEYISDMLRIARLLLKVTPHVIFATTTPVRDDNPHNHNSDIEKYNAMIVPELKKMGIAINDLYTALSPKRYEYIGGGQSPSDAGRGGSMRRLSCTGD